MRRVAVFFALVIAASSCSKCDSCKGSSTAVDGGGPIAEASAPVATPPTPPKPTVSAPRVEPNYACRMIARAITEKACECPQKNKMGCCYFGRPTFQDGKLPPPPYVTCSGGKTDWPAAVETALCEAGKDEKKNELLMACYAAKGNLRCGKTAQEDVGVEVPPECETLLKEVQASLTPKK